MGAQEEVQVFQKTQGSPVQTQGQGTKQAQVQGPSCPSCTFSEEFAEEGDEAQEEVQEQKTQGSPVQTQGQSPFERKNHGQETCKTQHQECNQKRHQAGQEKQAKEEGKEACSKSRCLFLFRKKACQEGAQKEANQ